MNKMNDTANKILDIAQTYTQKRGFNAFSYRDIQNELGIKTSSIHYYFPTKQDLAVKLIQRYTETYKKSLQDIDSKNLTAKKKLGKLADIFSSTATQGKFCLCGMLTADILSMSEEVYNHLTDFFKINEDWISKVLNDGIKNGEISKAVKPKETAASILALLEGGTLIARTQKNSRYLTSVFEQTVNQLIK